jgi:hypothetical protein
LAESARSRVPDAGKRARAGDGGAGAGAVAVWGAWWASSSGLSMAAPEELAALSPLFGA